MPYVLFLPFMPGSVANMNKLLSALSLDTLSANHHPTDPIRALFLWPPPADSPPLPCPEGHFNTMFLSVILGGISVLHLQSVFLGLFFHFLLRFLSLRNSSFCVPGPQAGSRDGLSDAHLEGGFL